MFDLKKEAEAIAKTASVEWGLFAGKTVLVTGATGLIGSCCVRILLERNRFKQSAIKILALVRSKKKLEDLFGEYGPSDGLFCVENDITDFSEFDEKIDYIIHTACPTASLYFSKCPVETIKSIVVGTANMLELAKRHKAVMVYVSSMEVYGNGNDSRDFSHRLLESEVGFLDPLVVRSCYPEGKRLAENLCVAYAHEYNVNVSIARLAQTFGPGISKGDSRVFAMIAQSVINKKDIVLKTSGQSTRMYLYPADAATAIFALLAHGETGAAYNIANENTYCSVKEMAMMAAKEFCGNDIKVIIDVDPNAPYPPEHHLPLNTEAIKRLGWLPKVGIKEMLSNLIDYLRE